MKFCRIETSAVGPLFLAGNDKGLSYLLFDHDERSNQYRTPDWEHDPAAFQLARQQLTEYFAGTRKTFDVPLAPDGTEFQNRVWKQLSEIPYGQTVTYSQIARDIGNPKACRAVGLANGRNPISIIVPCHRVIGANGQLVGYGGGLEQKQTLLHLEGITLF